MQITIERRETESKSKISKEINVFSAILHVIHYVLPMEESLKEGGYSTMWMWTEATATNLVFRLQQPYRYSPFRFRWTFEGSEREIAQVLRAIRAYEEGAVGVEKWLRCYEGQDRTTIALVKAYEVSGPLCRLTQEQRDSVLALARTWSLDLDELLQYAA